MKRNIPIILLLILNSCFLFPENGIAFSIENKSNELIRNVKFSTSEYLTVMHFDSIAPNQERTGFLSMKNNKGDGTYMLQFTRANGTTKTQAHGYYTNGSPLNSWLGFTIQSDTILVAFSPSGY